MPVPCGCGPDYPLLVRQGVWDYLVYDTGFPSTFRKAESAGNPGSNPGSRTKNR